jgi:hypothetical protein
MKTVIAVIACGVLSNTAAASPILNHPGDPFSNSRQAAGDSTLDNSSLEPLSRCAQSWVRLADQSQPQPSDAAISSARTSNSASLDLTVCLMPSLTAPASIGFRATDSSTEQSSQASSLFANVIEAHADLASKSTSR